MRVAMLQAVASPSVSGNLARLEAALVEASEGAADVLVTPEMFLTGYNIGAEPCRSVAEPITGGLVSSVQELSSRHGVGALVGFAELDRDGRVYNALALVDADGTVVSSYRKTHLFGDIDRLQFSAGAELSDPVDFAGFKVGIAICYDVEFPEVVRSLAVRGAEVVLVPTASNWHTISERLIPARAQENGIWVAYVNYIGEEGKLRYCGQSAAAGPDGEIVAKAGAGAELMFVDFDAAAVATARSQIDYLADRRPDLYL